MSSLFAKARFKIVQVAIAKNCSRNALNKSANDTQNSSISIESKFGKISGKRLIFKKSHIPTNRRSHKDNQSARREDRLYSSSITCMNLEPNTKMLITITSSWQLCRLYVLKWPLPFPFSPITLLPTATKGTRARFTISSPLPHNGIVSSQWPWEMLAVPPTALAPTCDLQQARSWRQPPLCFLSLVSYGTASAAPTTARLPLRVPLSPYKGRYLGAVRGRVCLAALWLYLQSLK